MKERASFFVKVANGSDAGLVPFFHNKELNATTFSTSCCIESLPKVTCLVLKTGFSRCIGTMPRFVRAKTCFFWNNSLNVAFYINVLLVLPRQLTIILSN